MQPSPAEAKPAPEERAERERLAYALVMALAQETLPVHALKARARTWMKRFGAKESEG